MDEKLILDLADWFFTHKGECSIKYVKDNIRRILLQSQRKVTEKEVIDFHVNLQTIVMDCKDQEECIQRELNYIKTWLKELGLEVKK